MKQSRTSWHALGWLLLFAASCSEEISTRIVEDGTAGRISGTVRVPGSVGPGRVWIESVERLGDDVLSWPVTVVRVDPAQDGSFVLEVPPGRYRAGIDLVGYEGPGEFNRANADGYWSRHGIVETWRQFDTLVVEAGGRSDSIDFEFGMPVFEIEVPEQWSGHRVSVSFESLRPNHEPFWLDWGTVYSVAASGVVTARLPLLQAGDYRVHLRAGYFEPELGENVSVDLWLPNGIVREEGAVFSVKGGDAVVQRAIALPERFSLRGTVDGVWSSVGSQAPHAFLFSPDSVRIAWILCKPNGDFLLSTWARVPVKLAIGLYDHPTWVGGGTFEEATLFRPPESGDLTGIQFTDSAIQLNLHGLETWLPEDALLTVVDPSGRVVSSLFARFSDQVTAAIPFLNPGVYRLRIEPYSFLRSEWSPQWYDRTQDLAIATQIEVTRAGETVNVDVAIERGAVVRGRVHRTAGEQVAFRALFVTRADASQILGVAGGEGELFELRGLPPGRFKLAAARWNDGGARDASDLHASARWYPYHASWEDAEIITISGPDTLSGIDILLP